MNENAQALQMANSAPVVTLDGPTGSGKGTIGVLLAEALNWHFLDSGALYRVLALTALEKNIPPAEHEAIEGLALQLQVDFINVPKSMPRVIYQGFDVTSAIRQEGCGVFASQIAVLPGVRAALLKCQRGFRIAPGLVADGRDMGTIVFPDAILKVFLTADVDERARRRFAQLQEKGISANYDEVRLDLIERDMRDEKRIVAPLKVPEDALVVDTTGLGINEIVEQLLQEIRAKL